MKNKFFNFIVILVWCTLLSTSVSADSFSKNEYNDYLKRNEKLAKLSLTVKNEMSKINNHYLDYFGGMYISDDARNLVLLIVKKNIPNNRSYDYVLFDRITKLDDSIVIKYVDHSYMKLQNVYEKINDYYKKANYKIKETNFSDYAYHYVDIKSNSVIVAVTDNLDDKSSYNKKATLAVKTKKFKKNIIDSNAIKFEIGQIMNTEATELKPGQGIETKEYQDNCSLGYRAKINGRAGYITAGHCFNENNEYSTGGVVKRYNRGGKVDAAFVQTYTSFIPLNYLAHLKYGITRLNNNSCPIILPGRAIAHDGITSKYQSGIIKSSSFAANDNGI